MLELSVSLYTSVYWTKRVLVVLALVLFVCGGFRIFQFVSTSLTKTNIQVSEFKPEIGFKKINRPVFEELDAPSSFSPTQFRITTTKGNLDADNGYPLDSTKDPIANVYRITEKEITLATTEDPVRIARKIGLTTEPKELSSTERQWEESGKILYVDGLYTLVNYKNNTLRQTKPQVTGGFNKTDQNVLKTQFINVLREFDIVFPDQTSYVFDADYVDYNAVEGRFVNSGSLNSGSHIRINAKRIYPNLVKTNSLAQARGAYPQNILSNNYVVLPASIASNSQILPLVAELSLYNWPINQSIAATNPNVQTYPIKNPRQAYTELTTQKRYLISAIESSTKKQINTNELSGINLIDVLSVRLDNYESNNVNTKFIQPVYIFLCEANINGKKVQLTYYVPAVLDSQLL